MKKFWIMSIGMIATINLFAAPVIVKSPDGRISVAVEEKGGSLFYSVQQDDRLVVKESKIELFAGTKMTMGAHSIRENNSTWSPVHGQFSTIRDHHRELSMQLEADDTPVKLLCRVFDDGLGFRFVLSEESKGKKIGFYSVFNVMDGVAFYWGERGSKYNSLTEIQRVSPPFMTEGKDGTAMAFLESDLYSAAGFESMKLLINKSGQMTGISETISQGADHVTPWRVILFGESSGALTVNNVVLNLAAPCKLEDTSWIKSGKGLWDWRVHGYDNGEFVYDINTKSYLRFIDFCSEQGIEYFTIDDHWFSNAENGTMDVSPEVDIEKVMRYAKEKNVKIMLYYDRLKGDFGDETLFSHYAKLGASGIKYGFMGNKAEFTRNAIDAAAENKLLINFHDGPCPMAGVERTMPNLIAREFCHGQQDSRRAFTPESFLKMAVVSSLTGPLDQSNGNFGLGSIKAGERKKGPKKINSYI
jgi:alpha-glucosidase